MAWEGKPPKLWQSQCSRSPRVRTTRHPLFTLMSDKIVQKENSCEKMIFLCAKRSQIGASGGKQEMWMTPSTLKPRRMRQEPMVVIRNRLRKFFSSTFGKFSHFVCWSFFSKFYDERKEEKNPFREGKMFRLRKFFSTLWEMSWKGLLFGWENGIFLSCFLFSNRVSSLYSRFNRAAGSCDDDHVDNKKML